MKVLVGAFNQEKALVGAFSVIVQPVVEPMDRFTALTRNVAAGLILVPPPIWVILCSFRTVVTTCLYKFGLR